MILAGRRGLPPCRISYARPAADPSSRGCPHRTADGTTMGHRLSKIVTRTGDAGTTGPGRRLARGQGQRRASRRSAPSTSSTRRSACCSPSRCPTPIRRSASPTSSTICSTWAASCRFRATPAVTDAHVAAARGRRRALQRRSRAAEGVHPARRNARGGARARRAHRLPPRRTRRSSSWPPTTR